jgi:ubiquinone/menaquinone biosynthesis methyltransferase
MAEAPGTALSKVSAPAELAPDLSERAAVGESHAAAVQQMFDRVAPTYDLLNRLLSGGTDIRWRKKALEVLGAELIDGPLLDSCAGTLDFAAAMVARWPERSLVAGDFSRDMLVKGRGKPKGPCSLIVADAMRLPLASDAFAGMTCGFGMRNLSRPADGIHEAYRVLKPGGVFLVLEFFKPTQLTTRMFHAGYARGVLPFVGGLISGERKAYRYLSESMQGFLTRHEFEVQMREAGFRDVRAVDLTLGIASLVWGTK